MTAVRGLWWCRRPVGVGTRAVLRPEAHHHSLEDHWAPWQKLEE